jgi:hypothetical protein
LIEIRPMSAPNGGYTRGLPGQTHCAAQRALEEIRSRIGTARPAAPSLNSSKRGSRAPGSQMPDKPLAALA